MYNQNIIDYMDEQKLSDLIIKLKDSDIKLYYWSVKEDDIKKRNAIEHYILKYFFNPHNSEESLAMKKYVAQIGKLVCLDPVHFTDSYLLTNKSIPYLYTKAQTDTLQESKVKQSKMALNIFNQMSKKPLSKKDRSLLASFFTSIIMTKNEDLKQAEEEYFNYILKENNTANNEELKFVLTYASHHMLAPRLNYKVYLTQFAFGNPNEEMGFCDNETKHIYINLKPGTTLATYLQTVCHESMHAIQEYEARHNPDSISSLNWVKDELLIGHLSTSKYDYYTKNYRYSSKELEADKEGFKQAKEFYHKINMPNMVQYLEIKEKIDEDWHLPQYEYANNEKDKVRIKEKFVVTNLNNIIKNNPQYLNDYPVLNHLYHKDGTAYDFDELMTSDTNDELKQIYHDHLIYGIGLNQLKSLYINAFDKQKQTNIMKNLIYLWEDEKDIIQALINFEDAYENPSKNNMIKLERITSNYHFTLFTRLTDYLNHNFYKVKELIPDMEETLLKEINETLENLNQYLKTKGINPIFEKALKAKIDTLNKVSSDNIETLEIESHNRHR